MNLRVANFKELAIMISPKVSIIVCVYNSSKFLEYSLKGIIDQTFHNYELIIVNDGSTDGSEIIIEKFLNEDVILINHQKNLGLIQSIRDGIRISRGEYISKIDSDDIPQNDLIKSQVEILDNYPSVGIVGVGFENIDEFGNQLSLTKRSFDNSIIQWDLMFGSPITHSGVMFRKDILINNSLDYREEFIHSEDYDLWSRFLNISKGINLREPLIKRRIHSKSVSNIYRQEQKKNHLIIAQRIINSRFPKLSINHDQIEDLIRLELDSNNILEIKNIEKIVPIYAYLIRNYKFFCENIKIYHFLYINKVKNLYYKLMINKILSKINFKLHLQLISGLLFNYLAYRYFQAKEKIFKS